MRAAVGTETARQTHEGIRRPPAPPPFHAVLAGVVFNKAPAGMDSDPKCSSPTWLGGPRAVIRVHAAPGLQNTVITPAKNTTFPGHIFLFAAVKQVYSCTRPPLWKPQSAWQLFMERGAIRRGGGDWKMFNKKAATPLAAHAIMRRFGCRTRPQM